MAREALQLRRSLESLVLRCLVGAVALYALIVILFTLTFPRVPPALWDFVQQAVVDATAAGGARPTPSPTPLPTPSDGAAEL
jgi:hypothetical protein